MPLLPSGSPAATTEERHRAYRVGSLSGPDDHSPQAPDSSGWPQHSYLELGSLPTAVPCARKHARLVTGEWRLPELADSVEIVVSELVTNALHACAGLTASRYHGRWIPGTPPIRIWLCSDHHQVLIQVWDGSDQHPAPQQPTTDAESGRGLLLVDMLTHSWGTRQPEGTTGKIIWASVTR